MTPIYDAERPIMPRTTPEQEKILREIDALPDPKDSLARQAFQAGYFLGYIHALQGREYGGE